MDYGTTTPDEIDDEFERTQPIGDMIHVLAEAELIIAAADELPPGVTASLDRILRKVADNLAD